MLMFALVLVNVNIFCHLVDTCTSQNNNKKKSLVYCGVSYFASIQAALRKLQIQSGIQS